MCGGLFICQLYLLPDLLEETDSKEDMPLTLPFCIIRFPLTVDNSDMNQDKCWYNNSVSYRHFLICSSSIEDSKGVGTGSMTVIKVLVREAIALRFQ
jgi:hypothetical protein